MLRGSARRAPQNFSFLGPKSGYISAMRPISASRFCCLAICLLLAAPVAESASSAICCAAARRPGSLRWRISSDPASSWTPKFRPCSAIWMATAKRMSYWWEPAARPCCRKSSSTSRSRTPMTLTSAPGIPRITSQFTLHFDGSSRCFLIVFDWRQPQSKSKLTTKFVLINTPFETAKHRALCASRRRTFRPSKPLTAAPCTPSSSGTAGTGTGARRAWTATIRCSKCLRQTNPWPSPVLSGYNAGS